MQWEYAKGTGFAERLLGAVPLNHAPAGGRIAIIGSGGGRQVQWALLPCFRFEQILALELEPAVVEAVRGPLRDAFGSVYEAPNVRVHVGEARSYMERTRETFDLIFLPSVGGYPQMMLEPGNMIRTADAYRTLRDRLTERGVLAIWYPRGLDPKNILTDQYVRTLGAQGLGMKTRAYANADEILILASRSPSAELPEAAQIDEFLTAPEHPSGLPPRKDLVAARTQSFFAPEDPAFKPITDDQPFLAGNVRHIFRLDQVYALFGIGLGAILAAGALLLAGLRRTGDPAIPGRSYGQVAALSLLIGANFILFEHFLILALFRKLYVYQDAVTVGAISFLVVSGLGSILVTPRARGWVQAAAAVLLLPVVLFHEELPPEAAVALVAPVAFATGSFFPAVFELAARNPIAVFAMDAVGAAVGSAFAFFVPIAFGFSAFFPSAAVVFLATAFATWRFCRAPVPAPGREAIIQGQRL
ncbi:MAG: hypothetical protein HY721_17305 [Planctomycetes bacterium]|nr:hypothetical protein [Planctomycetota bacterium]